MDFNTNGNLLQNGNPYLSAAGVPNNTTLYGKSSAATPSSSSSSVVPEVNGAVSKELTGAASTSFQRNQTDTQKVIDDYNKQIKAIESKISVLTVEKAKIEANLNNKDFSDEERRMIESYTTLGDLDAGVKQIMTSRQFKSALDQTQANETQANNDEKARKIREYEDAVFEAAKVKFGKTGDDGNMNKDDTKDYAAKATNMYRLAGLANVSGETVAKDLEAKIAQMKLEKMKANATSEKAPDTNGPAEKAPDTNNPTGFLSGYETLRKAASEANKYKKFNVDIGEVNKALSVINAKYDSISKNTKIGKDDKAGYLEEINKLAADLTAYAANYDEHAKIVAMNAYFKIAKGYAKNTEDAAFRGWLVGKTAAAKATRNRLGITDPKDVSTLARMIKVYRDAIINWPVKE